MSWELVEFATDLGFTVSRVIYWWCENGYFALKGILKHYFGNVCLFILQWGDLQDAITPVKHY